MLTALAVVLALVLLLVVLQDAFEVMLLPRRVHRRLRLSRYYFALAWAGWTALATTVAAGGRRERFLGVFGALSMMVLFALWAAALIAGFGLLMWALRGAAAAGSPLLEQIYMSGVTFFTLGYGDIVPRTGLARAAAVIEAGSGIGFIAVVIGYLPVLYQLFSRREAHVILLDARAGSPPTAGTMLTRHAEALGNLDDLLRAWEEWGSELLESHLSYPMLIYYRSQHDNQSWLAAITAVMDCCALIMVGLEAPTPLQARMTFTMARQVLIEIARSLGVRPSRYEGVDRLAHDDYARLVAMLDGAGLAWTADPEAEDTLTALRATYEPLLGGLSAALLLPVPGWMAAAGAADHWQGGHRGMMARRLIEQLSDRAPRPAGDGAAPQGRFAQRLRRRLARD